MHESLNGFDIWQNPTTDYGVSCPCAPEKLMYNIVNNLAPSFLIGSYSFLQVTRTIIKSGQDSKLSLIGPLTAELAALERPKNSP